MPVMSEAARRLVIGVVVGIAVVGAAVWFVASGDSSDDAGGGDGAVPGGSGSLDPACESLHEGHAAMAWNPTSADEMVESDCGWPYEPYLVSVDGGQEDPGIAAEFEPRLYQEVSETIGEIGLGLCGVNALPEDPGDGFVFGFRYDAAEPGCPDFTPTAELTAREYVTRAHRDAAANDAEGAETIVLGRWVLEVEGTDQDQVDELTAELIDLGGWSMDRG